MSLMGFALESITLMGFLAQYNELGEEEIQDLSVSGQATAKMAACSVEERSYANGHNIHSHIPTSQTLLLFYTFFRLSW